MDEFTMSAVAKYADGSRGDPFAQVQEKTLSSCFHAMAEEVAAWLAQVLEADRGDDPTRIELSLEWRGSAAPAAAAQGLKGPSDPARRSRRPARRSLRCSARRSPGRAVAVALPLARVRLHSGIPGVSA